MARNVLSLRVVQTDGRLAILELRSVRGTGGGPEKTILLGAERRDRTRFDVTVCYLRHRRDPAFAVRAQTANRDIDYLEVVERASFDPGSWRELRRLVRDRRIDIVHAHDYKTDVLALWLAHRSGVVPLATAHGWTGQTARERLLYYPLDKRVLARFPRVIAVSKEIGDELLRHGAHADRIVVLPNGIDPGAFRRQHARRAAVRSALGFGPDDFVVGAVGRLERQKRFDVLLEAVARLTAKIPAIALAIVGAGSLQEPLTQQATSLGLATRCRFLGHRTDVADLHHAFDLFVQSSEYEGTSNAVLEAMALETPIVATEAGGTVELTRPDEHALIVPVRDPVSLAAGINTVFRDPAGAQHRAAAARRRVETELSFDARTRRLEAIYLDLMRARHGAATMPDIMSTS
jgi:glycosyltransferase involved in cell wall biosynthesis